MVAGPGYSYEGSNGAWTCAGAQYNESGGKQPVGLVELLYLEAKHLGEVQFPLRGSAEALVKEA